jgi:hypothetical protein
MHAVFRQSGSIDENTVYAEGQLNDGTIIRIEAKKGDNYKSPKSIALEIREKIKSTEEEAK